MKKKIRWARLAMALAFLCSLCLMPLSVSASTKKTQFIDANFASDAGSDAWTLEGGAAVKDYGGAIKIAGGDFSTSVGWKGLRASANDVGMGDGLTSDYSLEVTVSMRNASWIAVYVGVESPATRFSAVNSDGKRASVLVISTSTLIHYVAQGTLATADANVVAQGSAEAQADAAAHNSSYALPEKLENNGKRYCLKFDAHFGGDGSDRSKNTMDVYIAEEPDGRTDETVIGYKKVCTLYYVNVAGYFSFGSTNSDLATFSNIRITDPEGKVLYEPANDLKTETVEHIVSAGSAEYKDYEFRVWNTTSGQYSSMIYNEPVGALSLSGDSTALLSESIQVSAGVYSAYDISFYMNLMKLEEGASLSVVLGSAGENLSALTFACEGGEYTVGDGTSSETLDAAMLSGTVLYTVEVKTDNTARLSIGGSYVGTFGAEDVGGQVGISTQAAENGIGTVETELETFSVYCYSDSSSDAASVSADFTLKDSGGRPYLDESELTVYGSALRLANYDEIAFVNAKKDSMLATRQQYADYVVKFDLCDITQDDSGNIIVFSFAKPTASADRENSLSIIFVSRGYTEDDLGMPVSGYTNIESLNGVTFNTGSATARLEDNFYAEMEGGSNDEGHTAINVMFIVKDRSISIYYKYNDEPESELAILRAKIEDVDTFGYFSIGATTNAANFSVKNFSITNLNI